MVARSLEDLFPALRGQPWAITSSRDQVYNCISWAAGVSDDWWWPDAEGRRFWPPGIARTQTLEVFRDAFASLGYGLCDHEYPEPGFEKVALFALEGLPLHAARQLPNGRWTSKLGEGEDIEHNLHDLTGLIYGSVAVVMKRPLAAPVGMVASSEET